MKAKPLRRRLAVAALLCAWLLGAASAESGGEGWWPEAPLVRWGEPWLGPALLREPRRSGVCVGRLEAVGDGVMVVRRRDGSALTVAVPPEARLYRDGRACSLAALAPIPQGQGLPDLAPEVLVAYRPTAVPQAYYVEAVCPVVEVVLLDTSPGGLGCDATSGAGGAIAVAAPDGGGDPTRSGVDQVYILEVLPGPWESIAALDDVRGRSAVVVLDIAGRVRAVRLRL